jgi:hypothetical protein
MKNSIDTIGNRTPGFPACSAVPQPTAPPRTLSADGRRMNMEQYQVEIDVLGKKIIPVRNAPFWVFTQRRMDV